MCMNLGDLCCQERNDYFHLRKENTNILNHSHHGIRCLLHRHQYTKRNLHGLCLYHLTH